MVDFTLEPEHNNDSLLNPIVSQAQDDFKRTDDWESYARKMFLLDVKFHNADSDNGFQWPDDIRKDREVDAKPCLTINDTRQHNLQLINELTDNSPAISIRPTGNGATKAAADVWEGIVRRIQYQSQFKDVQEVAVKFMITGGIGYWRLITDYEDPRSFNQDLYIVPINDPLSVMMDPDIEQKDGSDAKFCFVFKKSLKDDVRKKYPKLHGLIGSTPLGFNDAWIDQNYCIEAEYWVKEEISDTLYQYLDSASNEPMTILASEIPEVLREKIENESTTRKRKTHRIVVKRHLIVGDQLAETKTWPGDHIPIVRLPGEEYVVDGIMDRRGHTRAMKDPQRMYNYWTSSAVENVALQSKVPWIASSAAIEGYEYMWDTANTVNYSVLVYNGLQDDGVTPIPPPSRPPPPVMAQAYIQGMEISRQELMSVSGQAENSMGQADNERTGRAIQSRQMKGDTATSHFMRNLGMALRFTGKIILNVVPKIYDVERVTRILAENGTDSEVLIDPQAKVMLDQQIARDQDGLRLIFNPTMGNFSVEADIGPGYATKRQQAFEAFTQILTQAPDLTHLIGDIMLREGDFPGAEDAAQRLERMVPPQALGQGPSPNEQKLMQALQQANASLQKLHQENSILKLRETNKGELRDVEAYNAETQRLKVLKEDLKEDPTGLAELVRQMVRETLATTLLNPITQSTNPAPPLTPWGGGQPPTPQPSGPQAPGPQSGPMPPQGPPVGTRLPPPKVPIQTLPRL
jgi:hypothetical protein